MSPILIRMIGTGSAGSGFGFGRRRGGPSVPFSATGGNVDALAPGNGYKYHTFTSPGTFTVNSGSNPVEYLVVAGGGGGGTGTGGGGGAGGVKYAASYPINPGSYPVTVGPGAPPSAMASASFDGNPSVFGSITATGGGRGASGGPSLINTASPGGSGGGGSSYPSAPAPTAGTGNPGEGNPGGDGSGNNGGGGGGGAGAAGASTPGGTGGIGVQYPQFTGPLIGVPSLAPLSGYFGGGGGGTSPGGNASSGGLGGGGTAALAGGATSGVTNSGGGGGANWSYTPGLTSGGGGSGIVIIRYLA
jgi:hypothetical protein